MGIFDDKVDLFTQFRARLTFRDRLMGGTPMAAKPIEGWLEKNLRDETTKTELKRMALRTLLETNGLPAEHVDALPDDADFDAEIDRVVASLAATKQTVGFKRGANGLYIESRHVKAMLKECINILYAGDRWGKTKKGPKSYVAERVFVNPARIYLGLAEPDGVDLFVGHVTGPQGPRSTLTYYEFAQSRSVEFDVLVTGDAVKELEAEWPRIWVHAQENGLGALRSQDHGKFDIEAWDIVEPKKLNGKIGKNRIKMAPLAVANA